MAYRFCIIEKLAKRILMIETCIAISLSHVLWKELCNNLRILSIIDITAESLSTQDVLMSVKETCTRSSGRVQDLHDICICSQILDFQISPYKFIFLSETSLHSLSGVLPES